MTPQRIQRDLRDRCVSADVAFFFKQWAWLNRCDDRAGCRARVQVAGKPWPIIDGKGIS